MTTTNISRYKNFKAWIKILKPRYKTWYLYPIGPIWFWFALENSKTHWADEEVWAKDPRKIKPIHKYKY